MCAGSMDARLTGFIPSLHTGLCSEATLSEPPLPTPSETATLHDPSLCPSACSGFLLGTHPYLPRSFLCHLVLPIRI